VGSSFANIHVRVETADPETALDQASAAVADWLKERGFAPVRGSGSLISAAFPRAQIESGGGPAVDRFEITVTVR